MCWQSACSPGGGKKKQKQVNQGLHVYPPALWRLPPTFLSHTKPYIYRGAKCLEILSRLWAFSQHLKDKTRGDISLTTVIEDNKRTGSVWGVMKKNRRCKSFVVACCWRKIKNEAKKKSALQWSLVWHVRCQWWIWAPVFYTHQQLPLTFFFLFKETSWFAVWKQQSKCQGV